ncbi:hypothetical protein DSO57_1034457 [Entomophthora muscae]|uniref:Uncharacterized protein n=1 Tax=Entomophthora muscae TaxID=34485 RepID=A0ACC2TAK1_9FUNG|nr:hypothetical protein DSO57_1034457 [Entomophthora muscae]
MASPLIYAEIKPESEEMATPIFETIHPPASISTNQSLCYATHHPFPGLITFKLGYRDPLGGQHLSHSGDAPHFPEPAPLNCNAGIRTPYSQVAYLFKPWLLKRQQLSY